ncbi:sensor histidine kinase [Pseudonocardia xinjiangensis]|uniref:GAF domain-containing protein n=1 Tax=Pseudonocardia xinjiangensis TaxID=75289 RepID=A0ABX1RNZ3_9PSEU|nr:ATP-binding protein [Pseudonocardia xinjiangensis]NMH82108.1 GAF domain-containing protein [Pseudonocardia xinjiangensis]
MSGTSGSAPPPTRGGPPPAIDLSELAAHAPDGLAVVDEDGLFVQLNSAAVVLCARPVDDLIGMRAPFELASGFSADSLGLLDDGATEQICTWAPAAGVHREFAYRTRPLPQAPGRTVVAFRDVGAERHRQRRVAAIARSSVKMASEGSITATLDALAREVLQADALAGVQILTLDESGAGLQIMGSAGFRCWPDFFERLMQCRERGATLEMIEAFERREPVVVPDRWDMIQRDPAWEPMHDYHAELEWGWFASVPIVIRGRPAGILNAFFAPGQVVGQRNLEFLLAMAEQAAVAIDYAALLQNERELARREERQRLARDLHDSIVQQVFSIGMQAKSMEVLAARGASVPAESVRRVADEVGLLAKTVLADLRTMVHELRPSSSTQLGLAEAVRALAESTTNRTGLRFSLSVRRTFDEVPPDMAEDVYRIVAEAIHNVVKHAEAGHVTIRIGIREHALTVSVADDGRGIRKARAEGGREAGGGYGLTSMRERAARWGGTVRVRPRAVGGTSVRAVVPLPRAWAAPDPDSDTGAEVSTS